MGVRSGRRNRRNTCRSMSGTTPPRNRKNMPRTSSAPTYEQKVECIGPNPTKSCPQAAKHGKRLARAGQILANSGQICPDVQVGPQLATFGPRKPNPAPRMGTKPVWDMILHLSAQPLRRRILFYHVCSSPLPGFNAAWRMVETYIFRGCPARRSTLLSRAKRTGRMNSAYGPFSCFPLVAAENNKLDKQSCLATLLMFASAFFATRGHLMKRATGGLGAARTVISGAASTQTMRPTPANQVRSCVHGVEGLEQWEQSRAHG